MYAKPGKVIDNPRVAKAIKGFLGSVAPTVNVTTKTQLSALVQMDVICTTPFDPVGCVIDREEHCSPM